MDRQGCFFKSKEITLLSQYDRWRKIAKLLNLSHHAKLRLEWLIYLKTNARGNVALTARHFGLARKTIHQWLKRFDQTNLRSLEAISRRPHHSRKPSYTALEEDRIRALRHRYSTAGREKLIIFYQEDFGEAIKPWHMRRIIHDRRLYAQRAVKTKTIRQHAQGRVVARKRITDLIREPITGFLVEADGIVIYFPPFKRYIFTAIDYHTRISFAYMYKTKGSRNAADFLRRLVLMFGGALKNLHIDNGSEFNKDFTRAASSLGVTLYHARPYQPKDKPLVERFNGIIKQEFINLGNFCVDPETFNRNLVDWLIYYNFKRPHHSLGLRRPIEIATLKASKVLPMWSPMTNA